MTITPFPFQNPLDSDDFNDRLDEIDAAIGAAIANGFVDAATTLEAQAASGQKVLNTVVTTGFIVGDSVWVGTPGSGLQETGVIASISAGVSLTLVANLASTHAIGAPVSRSPAEIVNARSTFTTLGKRLDVLGQGLVNVKAYGALGVGTDDTTAIAAAFAASPNGALYFPPGNYLYDGAGLDGDEYHFIGAGALQTKITIATGDVFMKPSVRVTRAHVEGIEFSGGSGAFQHTYATNNVNDGFTFLNCIFTGYTGAAIGSLSEDCPYWRITGCVFNGTSTSSIGIALSGDNAGSIIERNAFLLNRYHIKVGWCGVNFVIRENDFIRFDTPANATTAIWLVTRPSIWSGWVQAPLIIGNKFGNENLRTTDYHILCAAEGAGATFFVKNHSAAASGGQIEGLIVTGNRVWGAGVPAPPLIYSTVDKMTGLVLRDNKLGGDTDPAYLVEFLTANPVGVDWTDQLNYIGPNSFARGLSPSNRVWFGNYSDPLVQTPSAQGPLRELRAGSDPEYAGLVTFDLAGYTLSGMTRTGGQVDGYARTAGYLLEVAGASGYAVTPLFTPVAAKPIFIELDVLSGGGAPVATMNVQVIDTVDTTSVWNREIGPGSVWRTHRFWFVPRSTHDLQFYITILTGTVKVARTIVYQAREPINQGPVILEAGTRIYSGAGTPEGAVTAAVGWLYLRTDGSTSTTLYVKTSGSGNTGWTAK